MPFYEDTGGAAVNILAVQAKPGTMTTTVALTIRNTLSGPLEEVRVFAILLSGLVSPASAKAKDEHGKEAVAEKWVEARKAGDPSFKPIGGPYGTDDSVLENYLPLDDIPVGGTVDLEVRLNFPVDAATLWAAVRFGVSFRGLAA